MYVEILCPRCLAAVSGRRPPNLATPRPPSSVANDAESEDSLTETDIVETQVVSDEGRRDE